MYCRWCNDGKRKKGEDYKNLYLRALSNTTVINKKKKPDNTGATFKTGNNDTYRGWERKMLKTEENIMRTTERLLPVNRVLIAIMPEKEQEKKKEDSKKGRGRNKGVTSKRGHKFIGKSIPGEVHGR